MRNCITCIDQDVTICSQVERDGIWLYEMGWDWHSVGIII